MKLCKLTKNNISVLAGKKICCVEKSVSYLEELCQKYDVLNQISCIVDTNRRNQGEFTFHEKEIDPFSKILLAYAIVSAFGG